MATLQGMRIGRYLKGVAIVSALILPSACFNNDSNVSNDGNNTNNKDLQRVPLAMLQLKAASDCDDLKGYIKSSLIKQYASIPRNTYYYCGAGGGNGGPAAADGSGNMGSAPAPEAGPPANAGGDAAAGGSTAGSADQAAPGDVSDTNNQEAGVNESDIVKADADGNVYVLSGRHFIVVNGFPPANMSKLAEIDLGARGLNMFLDKTNKRVTILAHYNTPYYITTDVPTPADDANSVIYPPPASDYTVALFYDVSNPASPQLIDQIRMRGYYRDGRRIDGRLHLVSDYYIYPLPLFQDSQFNTLQGNFYNAIYTAPCTDPSGDVANNPAVLDAQAKLTAYISDYVDAIDPTTLLPDAMRVVNGDTQSIPYLACSGVNHPEINDSLGMQVITSVDTNGENLAATAIVNNSYITYASKDKLYLVENSYSWWWPGPDSDTWPASQAAIYKFAISAAAPKYLATGRVEGYVKNQFSLSEFNGALRVASTQDDNIVTNDANGNPLWQRVLTNHLSVLKQNDAGELAVIGEVRNFADNESIRSARFFDDRGFVVTFRSVDPLFTFDLSVPEQPKLAGEVTIPGFSTYIHQYDQNTLLTIGRAGAANGSGIGIDGGIQLQLVDVSDMAHPQVVKNYTMNLPNGSSWSDAQYDHKAFTFYAPANLLAIPVQYWVYSSTTPPESFSGIIAFDVTLENGFKVLGRVDHSDLAYDYYCADPSNLVSPYPDSCLNYAYTQWASPRRSVVMTDAVAKDVYLFTISDVGMKAASIHDLNTSLGNVVFPVQPYPWWWFGYIPVDMPIMGGGIGGGGIAVDLPASGGAGSGTSSGAPAVDPGVKG